jgi:hypothetical protein
MRVLAKLDGGVDSLVCRTRGDFQQDVVEGAGTDLALRRAFREDQPV